MKSYETYLNESFLNGSSASALIRVLESKNKNIEGESDITNIKTGGYADREYIEFTFRGRKYKIIEE